VIGEGIDNWTARDYCGDTQSNTGVQSKWLGAFPRPIIIGSQIERPQTHTAIIIPHLVTLSQSAPLECGFMVGLKINQLHGNNP